MLSDLDFRNNAIGALRLLFAAAVVVSHAYTLGGFGDDFVWRWSSGRETLGNIAVAGFFVLSGFLIARSAERTPIGVFFWHRFLRIFPAFWVCLAVTALILGPIVATIEHRPLLSFFSSPVDNPFRYLWVNVDLSMRQYGIAGLLEHVPYKTAFDGSLWTLRFEFGCYALLAVLFLIGLCRGTSWLFAIGVAAVYLAYGVLNPLLSEPNRIGAELIVYFFIGAAAYLFRERIPMGPIVGIAGIVATIVFLRFPAYAVVLPIALPAGTLWLVSTLPLRSIDRHVDLSYGLYIYAFPMQQLAASVNLQSWGLGAFMLIPLAGTLVMACGSWFLIEQPSLRLKNALPSRTAFRNTRETHRT